MLDHIYGRGDLLARADRPHMFIKELELYIDDFARRWREGETRGMDKTRDNLLTGIAYYEELANTHFGPDNAAFLAGLARARSALESTAQVRLGQLPAPSLCPPRDRW